MSRFWKVIHADGNLGIYVNIDDIQSLVIPDDKDQDAYIKFIHSDTETPITYGSAVSLMGQLQ